MAAAWNGEMPKARREGSRAKVLGEDRHRKDAMLTLFGAESGEQQMRTTARNDLDVDDPSDPAVDAAAADSACRRLDEENVWSTVG